MPGVWSGRLRSRGPKRTDAVLMAIHDALCPQALRYIALLHLLLLLLLVWLLCGLNRDCADAPGNLIDNFFANCVLLSHSLQCDQVIRLIILLCSNHDHCSNLCVSYSVCGYDTGARSRG